MFELVDLSTLPLSPYVIVSASRVTDTKINPRFLRMRFSLTENHFIFVMLLSTNMF